MVLHALPIVGSVSDPNDTATRVRLFGGGLPVRKSFLWRDLAPYALDDGRDLVAGRYELMKYSDIEEGHQIREREPHAVCLDVPLRVVAGHLNVEELKVIAALHEVVLPRNPTRTDIVELFDGHQCDRCRPFVSVFLPCSVSMELQRQTYRKEYSVKLAASVKPLPASVLRPYTDQDFHGADAICDEVYPLGLKFVCLEELLLGDQAPLSDQSRVVCDSVPWLELARKGNKSLCMFLGKLHGIPMITRISKKDALSELSNHVCVGCKRFYAVFEPVANRPRAKRRTTVRDVEEEPDEAPDGDNAHAEPVSHAFPPSMNSDKLAVDIMRDFCRDVHPSKFEEAGCASCGQLTPLDRLEPLQSIDCSLDPLVEPNLARIERLTPSQSIRFATGPILAEGCSGICPSCLKTLRKGHRPVNALANGLWVREVPDVLSGLTYAEQCLVARVHTNRYVVRVASGHTKLMGNAIAFPNPTAKVYQKLPPCRSELDDVLAFIFTGVKPPSEEELGRTPMLVRRNAVGAALEWLKLNHVDYSDLQIDVDALNSYPESGVPVKVVYRSSDDASNTIASSTSVHEVVDEHGTDAGMCTFTVHGLVGANLNSMSMSARKAAALHHLRSGGHVLAVGHSDIPESMYDNPQFYPQMYPWLFPYGAGGIGNARLRGLVSETRHKRLLLLYHDKRFQTDARFVLLAFNHEQMKTGTGGSFILARRSNFDNIVRGVSNVDPSVLMSISNRLKVGERVIPKTEDEKRCFALMDQIEHVGASVHGSLSGKKIMRSELWSLIAYQGAPSWFITLSPVDTKHPICIYWADNKVKFNPIAREYNERARLVASNPVAGARFFHFLVELFVKHMLRWLDPSGRPGLFGNTAGYYGTVEQQGRMTLHLHMLIWVSGALSPKVVREKLLAEDSEFQRELIAYLESCHIGEFLTGSMSDIKTKLTPSENNVVDDPTQRLPVPPPSSCLDYAECNCCDCVSLRKWVDSFKETVDNVVFRSNVHKCYVRRDVVSNGVHKQHVTGKGCINKHGVCTARFPRDTHPSTRVDGDGRIIMKKLEPSINTVNAIMAYAFACNTDATSLGSGTAVNAIVGYVADYIVKMGLKSYQIFSAVYDVFERNTNIWNESKSESDAARHLILKMANSLTSKVEIGGPMASLYLLGNPDRYSSHSFVPLYWRQYMLFVLRTWDAVSSSAYSESSHPITKVYATFQAPTGTRQEDVSEVQDDDEVDGARGDQDNVLITRTSTKFISRSHVDDYSLRPLELEHLCVYDWVRCAVRRSVREMTDTRKNCFRYAPGHPLQETHVVVYDERRAKSVVPNFTGGYLPRSDGEDRDTYGCAMLSLFAPWRTGLELRTDQQTWASAFDAYPLDPRHSRIIENLNIRYECYDARDDFHSQMKLRLAAQQSPDGEEPLDVDSEDEDDLYQADAQDVEEADLLNEEALGVWMKRRQAQMKDAEDALYTAGWVMDGSVSDLPGSSVTSVFSPERLLPASKWKELLNFERKKALSSRSAAAASKALEDDMDIDFSPRNDARVVPGSYLLSDFRLSDVDVKTHMQKIIIGEGLNKEQERAFRIIANHSISVDPDPLQMYIGGMGGTGKSRVIDALKKWFYERGESYRMVVLAPTGAAASIIGGSTYHSFLGVKTGERRGTVSGDDPTLDDARKRMFGVVYIFLDEISMVSCHDFYLIDQRLKDIAKVHDIPFGGISIIVAGDFAQLPPAKGLPLYSGEVAKTQSPRQVQNDQENTMGLLLWHQFTTVVMLRQNMRQDAESPDDNKLRTVLEHMRFKDCTAEDLDFLRSRIPAFNSAIDMSGPEWRNVSVITAWNTHKDQINDMNAVRFAREHGQVLHYFYSVDKESRTAGSERDRQPARTALKPLRLSASVQECLWRSPPFTSQHIPACLALCIDMPVMIRYNEATELCVTKGQEAVVKGWMSREMRNHPGRQCLDVLFVELVNPPRKVQLPYLPLNVVPLTKISTSIQAVLPNDITISISRQQIPVLLNFAMTDYASQGKTRTMNVVDIKHCRNHQAMYTCLSRGRTAGNTVILRAFKESKLQGGLSGYLRQEFRELDALDEITRLRYVGSLPPAVVQRLRDLTLTAYKEYQGHSSDASTSLVRRKRPSSEVESPSSASKRRRIESLTNAARGQVVDETTWLSSWTWDSVNWSCAFDAYLTILRFVWTGNRGFWTEAYSGVSLYLRELAQGFAALETSAATLSQVRTTLRERMWSLDDFSFPQGPNGTDICALIQTLQGLKQDGDVPLSKWTCSTCGKSDEGTTFQSIGRYIMIRESFEEPRRLSECLLDLDPSSKMCGACSTGELTLDHTYPPMIALQLPSESLTFVQARSNLIVDSRIQLNSATYTLAGVVYYGESDYHFASRVIDSACRVFKHDGMVGKGRVSYDGFVEPDHPSTWLSTLDHRVASVAVYVCST